MIFRVLGFIWIGAVGLVLAVVSLVGSWFLVVGGLLDLFTDSTLTSGVDVIDDANREALATHGGTGVGLVKIFILEPVLMFVVSTVLGVANAIGVSMFGIAWLLRRRRDA